MNQYKLMKFMERFWLVFSILSLLMASWYISKGDMGQATFPLITTFISGILFGLRRYQRLNMEKRAKSAETKEDSK